MTTVWNEQNRTASEKSQNARFDVGKVLQVESNEGASENALVPHIAKINVRAEDTARWMPVVIPVHGDVNVPAVNSRVLVGYMRGDRPFAIPIYAGDEDVPKYDVGQRILGHPPTDSKVLFEPNGDMTVKNDSGSTIKLKKNGNVIINNDGDVLIGDEDTGNTSPVARQGDSVEVDDPDSGTLTGTITDGSDSVESK